MTAAASKVGSFASAPATVSRGAMGMLQWTTIFEALTWVIVQVESRLEESAQQATIQMKASLVTGRVKGNFELKNPPELIYNEGKKKLITCTILVKCGCISLTSAS